VRKDYGHPVYEISWMILIVLVIAGMVLFVAVPGIIYVLQLLEGG